MEVCLFEASPHVAPGWSRVGQFCSCLHTTSGALPSMRCFYGVFAGVFMIAVDVWRLWPHRGTAQLPLLTSGRFGVRSCNTTSVFHATSVSPCVHLESRVTRALASTHGTAAAHSVSRRALSRDGARQRAPDALR